jgi:hypothetical protein
MKKFVGFIAIVIAGMFMACGGPDKQPEVRGALAPELDGAPQWVLMGCANMGGDEAPICGVGSASGTRNISMARSMAVGRGRTDLARNLQVKVKALYKDYMATTTGGEGFGTEANDEQHVVDVSKQITKTTLSGTQVAATWMSKTGTLWMLVKLDPAAFNKALSGMKQLDETVRRAIVERADKAFKELDEATDFQQ